MRVILFFSLVVVALGFGQVESIGQTIDAICFNYDEYGNRTSLNHCTVPDPNAMKADESQYFVDIYPNPTGGDVKIRLIGDIEPDHTTRYRIYNGMGQVIREDALDGNEITVNLDLFSKGVYIIKILHNNEEIDLRKIILQ